MVVYKRYEDNPPPRSMASQSGGMDGRGMIDTQKLKEAVKNKTAQKYYLEELIEKLSN